MCKSLFYKRKRTEINKKVSEKLTGRRIVGQTGEKNSNYKHGKFCVKNLTDDDKIQIKKTKRIQIICLTCGKTHEIKLSKKGQMFCSSICNRAEVGDSVFNLNEKVMFLMRWINKAVKNDELRWQKIVS